MSAGVPTRGRRRGLRLCLWTLPLWLPALALLLGILWFSSPLGRSWLESRIRAATGLDARVGGAGVSLSGGIALDDVRLLQPPPLRPMVAEPLLSIARIRVLPIWKSWLRGKWELQTIEFDSPRCVVPVELLGNMARPRHAAAAPPAPPAVASAPPAPAQGASPSGTPPAVAAPTVPPSPPEAALPPTGWIRLKNASFLIVSAASRVKRIEVNGIEAAIPVAGKSARSTITVGALKLLDGQVLSGFAARLAWRAPILSLEPAEATVAGVNITVAGKTAFTSGLPVQMDLRIPQQKTEAVEFGSQCTVNPGTIAANARFLGLLLAPSSWQGDLVAETLTPSAKGGGYQAAFDRGRAVVVLRGGLLSCVDARLIGDDLSVLGNATLLADGRLAAALRLVAPPDVSSSIVNKIFPGLAEPPSLTELSTPQRSAFDLEASGDLRHVFLKLGPSGPVIELNRSTPP